MCVGKYFENEKEAHNFVQPNKQGNIKWDSGRPWRRGNHAIWLSIMSCGSVKIIINYFCRLAAAALFYSLRKATCFASHLLARIEQYVRRSQHKVRLLTTLSLDFQRSKSEGRAVGEEESIVPGAGCFSRAFSFIIFSFSAVLKL